MIQWNLKLNSYIFIKENSFENIVYEIMATCLGCNMLDTDCASISMDFYWLFLITFVDSA